MNSLDKLGLLNELLVRRQITLFLQESDLLAQMNYPVSYKSIESINKLVENIQKNKQILAAHILSLRKNLLYLK